MSVGEYYDNDYDLMEEESELTQSSTMSSPLPTASEMSATNKKLVNFLMYVFEILLLINAGFK